MNRLIALLAIIIVILVAAVAYLLGQSRSGEAVSVKDAVATNAIANSKTGESNSSNQSQTVEQVRASQPVMIGLAGPNLDACGSNATVVGLNPRGDNFLAVKAAPRMDAPRIDKLGPDFEVYVCDESEDGKWFGVVYEPDGKPSSNCGVTTGVRRAQPYSGRCQSGWVYSKHIEIYAG